MGGAYDGFVASLNSNGKLPGDNTCDTTQGVLIFGTYWGGSAEDRLTGIAVDQKDLSVFVIGWTASSNYRTINAGIPLNTLRGVTDAVITCFQPNFSMKRY